MKEKKAPPVGGTVLRGAPQLDPPSLSASSSSSAAKAIFGGSLFFYCWYSRLFLPPFPGTPSAPWHTALKLFRSGWFSWWRFSVCTLGSEPRKFRNCADWFAESSIVTPFHPADSSWIVYLRAFRAPSGAIAI